MDEKLIDKAIETAKRILPTLTKQIDMQNAAQAVLNLVQVKSLHANKLTEELDEELAFVLGRVRTNLSATELMHVTQSALHLAHAKNILSGKTTPKKSS